MTTTQSYEKHAHQPRLTAAAGIPAIIAFMLLAVVTVRQPSLEHLALLCLAVSVFVLVLISRAYTVRLQDRIIRLEMLGRLDRLGRAADFARLSTRQLVALRFASNAELPALIDRALAETLTAEQIKQAVKEWQADLHRT